MIVHVAPHHGNNTIHFQTPGIATSGSTGEINCDQLPVVIGGNINADVNNNENTTIWERSTDQVNWEAVAAVNNTTYIIDAFPEEEFYLRRVIYTPYCSPNYSNILHIQTPNRPRGGFISADESACENEIEDPLVLHDHLGQITQWEVSIDNAEFVAVANSANIVSILPVNVSGQHTYRVLISQPGCDSVYSAEETIIIYPSVENEIITGDQTVCENEIPSTIIANQLTGGTGNYTALWHYKVGAAPWYPFGSPTNLVEFNDPLSNTTQYRRIVASGPCTSYSNTVTVNVVPPSDAGNFTNTNQHICPETAAQPITVLNYHGELTWQQSASPNGPWTDSGSNSATFDPGIITQATFLRVIAQAEYCEADISDVYPITTYQSIVGNTIGDDQVVCGTSAADIYGPVPSGGTGVYSYLWESSSNQVEWNPAEGVNNDLVYNPAGYIGTRYFRRMAFSGNCFSDTSNTVTVDIAPESDAGNFAATLTQSICYGETTNQIVVENFTGEIIDWLQSNSPSGPWTSTGEMDTVFIPQNLTETTYFCVVVQSSHCDPDTSVNYTVEVFSQIAHNLIGEDQDICINEPIENLIPVDSLAGGSGNNYTFLWQFRTSDTDWMDASGANNASNYHPENIEQTTQFRRLVSAEVCAADTSNTITITAIEPSNAGSFTVADQTLCPGEEADAITLADFTGTLIDWQMSPSSSGPWVSTNETGFIYEPGILTESTFFRAIVQNEGCVADTSFIYPIGILSALDSNIISEDQLLCAHQPPEPINGSVPSGGDGNYAFQWQYQPAPEWSWESAPGINTELNYQPLDLIGALTYRRITYSAGCFADTSNVVTVVKSNSVTADISGGGTFCPGDIMHISFNFNGEAPFGFKYTDGTELSVIDNITSSYFELPIVLTDSTTITITAISNGNCTSEDEDFESTHITFLPLTSIDVVSAGTDTSVCGLSVPVAGTQPQSTAVSTLWTYPTGEIISNLPEFVFEASQPGSYTLVYTLTHDACNVSDSDTIVVTLDLPETATITTNSIHICSSSMILEAVPPVFGFGYWNIPSETIISDSSDPTATISVLNFGSDYHLKWIVNSALNICPADTADLYINVDALSDAGEVDASALQICAGDAVTFTANPISGDLLYWLEQNESGTFAIAGNANPISTDIDDNTAISVVVQSGVCPADTSNWVFVTVDQPTQAGFISEDQSVCGDSNNGTLTLNDYYGDVLYWQSSTDGFITYDSIASTTPEIDFENLAITTAFRASVRSGVCNSMWSDIATVSVIDEIYVPFSLNERYCATEESIVLSTMIDEEFTGDWYINGTAADVLNPAILEGETVIVTFDYTGHSCGKVSADTTFIDILPEVEIIAEAEICGAQTTIAASTTVGSGYWTAGEMLVFSGETTEQFLEVMALDYGAHVITWTAQNHTCTNSVSHELFFFEEPTTADAGADQLLPFTYQTQLTANTPESGNGTWTAESAAVYFADAHHPQTTVHHLETGKNELTWTITNGNCPVSESRVVIEVLPLKIPDAFSPNGDQINDRYVIEGLNEIGPTSIEVWNRWGQIVFKSNDYQNDWEGHNLNGMELPTDTYFFLLKPQQLEQVFNGFIVIQR